MVFGDSGHRKAGPHRASADGVGESCEEGVLEQAFGDFEIHKAVGDETPVQDLRRSLEGSLFS